MLQHRSASSSRLSLDFPDLPGKPAYTLKPGQPSPGQHSLLRPPFAVTPSTGILTCFPSTTPFGLALGEMCIRDSSLAERPEISPRSYSMRHRSLPLSRPVSYTHLYANNFTLLSLTDKAFFVVFFHYLHSKFK